MAERLQELPVRAARTAVTVASDNTILLHFLRDSCFDGVIGELDTIDILRANAEHLTRIGREHALLFDEPAFQRGHEELAAATVESPLILLADSAERPTVRRFFLAGGSAVVPMNMPKEAFAAALRLALSGAVYAPPELWYQGFLRTTPAGQTAGWGTGYVHLTEREADVLVELSDGKNNKLIAHALGIAEPTVKMHLASLARKLGASNRTQVVARAMAMGLLRTG